MDGKVPTPVVKRLPEYLIFAERERQRGKPWISSQEMAAALDLSSSTVRQDLSYVDCTGDSGRGYETDNMISGLLSTLGATDENRMVIFGAGNLGRALALHKGFAAKGFRVCAILDSDPSLHGMRIRNIEVQSVEQINDIVKSQRIDIGVIAVPAEAAQYSADRLIAAGVSGILNLSAMHLQVPEALPIVDVRLVSSLLQLSYAMKTRRADSRKN